MVPTNISTIENVSLNVTGDTYLNGQLHVLNLTSDIATSITNNTSQITSLNTRLTADETNITTNTNSIISLNTRITTDETIIISTIASISSLNTRITTDESTINNLLSTGLTNNNLNFTNSWSVGSQNVFNPSAISNPLLVNSISSGIGDGNTYSLFNLAINSWNGIGFVDSYSKNCNILFDVRAGNINSKGTINGISNTVLGYLSNVTSDIQSQINSINSFAGHISYNSLLNLTTISDNVSITGTLNNITPTVLGYVNNVSSDIQSQFNSLTSCITTINSNVGNITNNNLTLNYANVQCGSLSCSSFYQYNLLSSLANIYNVGYVYTSSNYGLYICSLTTDNSRNGTTQTKYPGCSFYVYFMPSKSLVNIIFNEKNNFQIIASSSST